MSKKRGLGRGLSALIPAAESDEKNKGEDLREIQTDSILPNPNQPRQRVDENSLTELMESIRIHGLIQPIVVRQGDKENYEIIAGERRWLACKKLSMERIPAIVKNYNDLEASAAALIENIQREDLNAVDEAGAYKKLMEDHGLTQEELSARLGKSRSFIANMVRLLVLPGNIKEMLAGGKLTVGHARALLALPDGEIQNILADRIVKRHMSVRDTEEMVKKQLERSELKPEPGKNGNRESKKWENKLSSRFGRKINIKEKQDGSGSVIIRFSDREDLHSLLGKLNIN